MKIGKKKKRKRKRRLETGAKPKRSLVPFLNSCPKVVFSQDYSELARVLPPQFIPPFLWFFSPTRNQGRHSFVRHPLGRKGAGPRE